MMGATWTDNELAEFDKLVDDVSSRDQGTRSVARLKLNAFVKEHSKEKCDAMFAYLEQKPAKRKK